MDDTIELRLTVNGAAVRRHIHARLNLVDFLRTELGLTGTHAGCEHGVCGACTVMIDGRTARGCLLLAVQLDGAEVRTIEGLSDSGELRPLQDAFHVRNALQCGFCTPGMLLTAHEFLATCGAHPDRREVRECISGNYCRCTGYHAIVDAVLEVAASREVRP